MTKLTQLTEDSSPSGSDLAYTVKDPAGTPLSRKATWTNIVAAGLSAGLTDLGSRWTAASSAAPASLDFREDTDNGTNRIRVAAPSAVTADVTATLPDAAGTFALIDTSAYGAGWNGSTKAPTQDAVYDKVETLGTFTYSDFSPTLTQSGTVTKTDTRCRYTRSGKMVNFDILLTVTGTGTASNSVIVTLPVTAAAAGPTIGAARIYDTSANIMYRAVAVIETTTTVRLEPTSSTTVGALGQIIFTAALAAGDVVTFSGTYEAA